AVDPGEPLHGVEVAAGGERLVAGAGHDSAGDRGIVAGRSQRIDQLVERLLAKGVEHARPVDGDPGDLVLHLVEYVAVIAPVGAIARLRCGLCSFGLLRHAALSLFFYWLSLRSTSSASFLCSSSCSRTKTANSAGRLLPGSMPWARSPLTTSGLFAA